MEAKVKTASQVLPLQCIGFVNLDNNLSVSISLLLEYCPILHPKGIFRRLNKISVRILA